MKGPVLNSILALTSVSLLNAEGEWKSLLDAELSEWDIQMGVPHSSVEIDGYETFDDVRDGTPIGFNKDPKKVFRMTTDEEGADVLHITGEIYAGLITKADYENYHFSTQFKWGPKKWKPRLNAKKNSGILYHSVGDYDDFWKVWMTCLECEVQWSDCGDFIPLGDIRGQSPAKKAENGNYYFVPSGPLETFMYAEGYVAGRCFKPQENDPENADGEWNTVELYCVGPDNVHVINGDVVMVVRNPEYRVDGEWLPLASGKIQLQSEAAEIYYKETRIKEISRIPDDVAEAAGLSR